MKFLIEYNKFEINEKLTWKDFILWGSLFLGINTIKNNYSEYNFLKNLYSIVNSPTNIPTNDEKIIIEKIRQDLINDIRVSSNNKNLSKSDIIDSLINVKFIVIDSTESFSEERLGCFVNLESLKDKIINNFLSVPKENNIIIINKKTLEMDNCSDIVKHELYHYIDKLQGYYITSQKLDNFLDNKISNKTYLSKKLSMVFAARQKSLKLSLNISKFEMTDKSGKDVDLYQVSKPLVDPYIDKINYYKSREEIFSRWNVMRMNMLKGGFVKDNKITLDEISRYLSEIKSNDEFQEALDILLILDWSKIEDFNKLF